jgi:hypothetical protein
VACATSPTLLLNYDELVATLFEDDRERCE